ncbi:hypothetical protein PIB30_083693 [Stylosanthes scabra]|uniref:Uncharacterized protein n=1 Tax=Stylosanthes scabra TaxID=79078 RepID=A0ABU6UR61_9FABA|nr:hypothetical protein [Stylosanthes scabra]
MAEERASNSSTSTNESTTTDKTQPTPGTSGVVATAGTGPGVLPPPVSTPSTSPPYGLPHNYSPPYESTSRGGGVFNPRNPPPVTQYHAQGWHFPPPQGGGYNPLIFGTFPRPSMNNPPYCGPIHSTTPVIQPMPNPWPSQAAVSIPQAMSTGANKPIFLEMSRQIPLKNSLANNTVKSLAVFRQQIEESNHDLVNMLTQQMATVLTPMIENNNARIELVARQEEGKIQIGVERQGAMQPKLIAKFRAEVAKESARNEKITKKSLKAKSRAYPYAPKEPMRMHCHDLGVTS